MSPTKLLLSLVLVNFCVGEGESKMCQYNHSASYLGNITNDGDVFYCSLSKCSCDNITSQVLCYNGEHQLTATLNDNLRMYWCLTIGVTLILLVYPVILFFNINLASGPKQSLIFFYQCLPLVTPFGKVLGYFVLQNQIYDASLFLIKDPLFGRFYIFEYLKYIIALIEFLLVIFLVKCTCCPLQKCRLPWAKVRRAVRNFREKHVPKHSILHGICSIMVLAYGDLLAISSLIILNVFTTYCYDINSDCPKLCAHTEGVKNFNSQHYHDNGTNDKLNALIAVPTIIYFSLLLLPLSLIYYPSIPALFHKLTGRSLPHFPKLDPVFDVFQGVYKDKMRWFAGVHFLYRMILWVVFIGLSFNPNLQNFIVLSFLVVILGIHSLFQPYKLPKHNYIETLYLVYLVIIAIFYQLALFIPKLYEDKLEVSKGLAILTGFLGLVPLVGIVLFNICKLFRHVRKGSFSDFALYFNPSKHPSGDGDGDDPSNPATYYEVEWVARTLTRNAN